MTQTSVPRYASPVDYESYGPYGPGRGFNKGSSFQRPVYRFQGRITADGSSGYPAVPGRYHLYISWGCPWAQRTAIVRKLKGLDDVVSLSYVDDVRDGRGWAFREHRGPDPVNGFTLLAAGLRGDRARLRRPRLCSRALGPRDRQDRQQQLPRHHDRPRHPVRHPGRAVARPLPGAAAR